VLPFVRLGRELVRRGHGVTLVACELFEPLARRDGLEFRPLLDRVEYERIFANPRLWHPRWAGITFLRDGVLPFMRRQFQVIDEAYRAGECDLLVAPAQSLGARVAQAKHELPLATVHLAPYMLRSAIKCRKVSGASLPAWFPTTWKRAFFDLADFCGDAAYGRMVNDFMRELGLPRARHVFWEWWNSPERSIALFPDWFAEPQTDWPSPTVLAGFLPVDADTCSPLSDEVEAFLNAGPAPIVFTAGTAMAHGGKFFAESIRATQQLGARAILLTRYRDQLPKDLPADILPCDFVPLVKLLGRAAVMVHHGGIGTTAQALAAGVPQLPVPMSFDQPDNAYRVECLKVGKALPSREYRANDVARMLRQLTTDTQMHARCREVAGWCRSTEAVGIACDELESMVGGTQAAAVPTSGLRPMKRNPR
jgi:rhamnosyltransferase subunit B